jgi:hypothetical protein
MFATTFAAPLVEFAGHTMKQCACGTLFNAAIPGAACPECTFPLVYSRGDWVRVVDITAETHALYPETCFLPRILVERPDYADLLPDD